MAHTPRQDTVIARANRYIASCGEYTDEYERAKLRKDWENKEQRAGGIADDFKRRAFDPAGKRILEIGFGNGEQLVAFSRMGATMSGLEVNSVLHAIAQERLAEAGISADIQLYDGERLPYENESFDGIYSISVFEHTSNPRALIAEASRVLVPGGRFYLAFPNRLMPKETHSGFWFISFLPRALARRVLHLFNRKTIEELNLHFLSYFDLMRWLRNYELRVVFEYRRGGVLQRVVKRALAFFGIHHSAILPHIMVVLEKVQHAGS